MELYTLSYNECSLVSGGELIDDEMGEVIGMVGGAGLIAAGVGAVPVAVGLGGLVAGLEYTRLMYRMFE